MNFKDYLILYVDDDKANRTVMKHNLSNEFNLLITDSGQAALELMEEQPVAVLLADQRMPGMTGVDLAERVRQLYPDVVRVIVTAYSDLEATIEAINRAHVNRFIKKPWAREELVAVLRESIQFYENGRIAKQMQQRLMEMDRVTSLAIMASSIAHDLRQPLAYIEPNVEVLRGDIERLLKMNLSPAEALEGVRNMTGCIEDIQHGVGQFKMLSRTLLNSLRTQETTKVMVDVRQILEGSVAITRTKLNEVARLEWELPEEPVFALASEGRLMQLVVNLLLNAAQAIEPGAGFRNNITLRLELTEDRVTIEVEDTGCGIEEEKQKKIFTPFYTTKGQGGSGLGLAICQQIVAELRGTIDVRSQVGRGTCFAVSFPRDSGGENSIS